MPLRLPLPDLNFLNGFVVHDRHLRAGETVTISAEAAQSVLIVRDGIGFGYALFEDGRRQVDRLCYAADVLGLRERVLEHGASFLEAASDMRISVIDGDRLRSSLREQPRFEICWLIAYDAQLLTQWLAAAGQRNAVEGVAWFAGQAFRRARRAGLGRADRVPFPFRQQVIADALGLSLVHTNKTIRRLRAAGAFRIDDGHLVVADPEALHVLTFD